MWLSLMILTAVGAALGNLFISDVPRETQAFLKGCAAGAMLAMAAQTMLPEAFEHGGWLTGLLTVVGFLAAIFMGAFDESHQSRSAIPPAPINTVHADPPSAPATHAVARDLSSTGDARFPATQCCAPLCG